jgi:hypothetical protein
MHNYIQQVSERQRGRGQVFSVKKRTVSSVSICYSVRQEQRPGPSGLLLHGLYNAHDYVVRQSMVSSASIIHLIIC